MSRCLSGASNLLALLRLQTLSMRLAAVAGHPAAMDTIDKKSQSCNLDRVNHQKFYHLPLGKLVDLLKLYAGEYG